MHYRKEIDGLRALAVIPVILFHANFKLFSGGFVGVDVFFVISGYLITSLIVSELEQGTFSITRFYERRVRRILPALFLVTMCCIPFAWMWMPPSQFKEFAHSLMAVSLFASNILFWRESDYFAPVAEEKPLLHTWSLAVEEQYYLFFPIFLLLLWRFGRRPTFYLIVATAIISLSLSEIGWRHAHTANFFLALTRVWELFAGSICAFIQGNNKLSKSNGLSTLGLLLIVGSICLYSTATPFPSLYTLVPVLGTALIILFAHKKTWVAQFLSLKLMVGIGLISYSAYLWHQPLFAYARIYTHFPPSNWLMFGLACTSLVLAYFSWKYVEQPFRNKAAPILPNRKLLFAFFAALAGGVIIFGFVADNTSSFKRFLSPRAYGFYQHLDYRNTQDYKTQFRKPQCFYGKGEGSLATFDKKMCLNRSDTKKNYIILGDSHAAHLWYAIDEAFEDVNVMQATASGCRPLINYKGRKPCTELIRYVFEDFIKDNQVDGVILSGQWQIKDRLEYLLPTVNYLKHYVSNVIIIGPSVEYEIELPALLATNAALNNKDLGILARQNIKSDRQQINNKMSAILQNSTAQYVPLHDHMCDKKRCRVLTQKEEPMGFDASHITLSGAKTIVGVLKEDGALQLP